MTEKYWGIHSHTLPALVNARQTLEQDTEASYTHLQDNRGTVSYFLWGPEPTPPRRIRDWGQLLAALGSSLYQSEAGDASHLEIIGNHELPGHWQHWSGKGEPERYQQIGPRQSLPPRLLELRPESPGRFIYCPDSSALVCARQLLRQGIEVYRGLRLHQAYLLQLATALRADFLLAANHHAPMVLLDLPQIKFDLQADAYWLLLHLPAPLPTLLVTARPKSVVFPQRQQAQLSNCRWRQQANANHQTRLLPPVKARPCATTQPVQGLWLTQEDLPRFYHYWRRFPDWYLRNFLMGRLQNGEALVISWEKSLQRISFGRPFYCWWQSGNRFVFVPCGCEPQLPQHLHLPQQFPEQHLFFWLEHNGEFRTCYQCAQRHLYPIDNYLLAGLSAVEKICRTK